MSELEKMMGLDELEGEMAGLEGMGMGIGDRPVWAMGGQMGMGAMGHPPGGVGMSEEE